MRRVMADFKLLTLKQLQLSQDLDDLHHSFRVLQDVVLVDDVPSPAHDTVGLDVNHDMVSY